MRTIFKCHNSGCLSFSANVNLVATLARHIHLLLHPGTEMKLLHLLLLVALALLPVLVLAGDAGDDQKSAANSEAHFFQYLDRSTVQTSVKHTMLSLGGLRGSHLLVGTSSRIGVRDSMESNLELGRSENGDVKLGHTKSAISASFASLHGVQGDSSFVSEEMARRQAALQIQINVGVGWTSTTLANDLCPKVNASVASVIVSNPFSTYLKLPSCVGTSGSNIATLYTPYFIIEDVRYLPTSLKNWVCQFCKFPGPTAIVPSLVPSLTPTNAPSAPALSPAPATTSPPTSSPPTSSPSSTAPSVTPSVTPPTSSPSMAPNASPSSSTLGSGFDSNGNIVWSEVFDRVPLLNRAILSDGDLSGPLPEVIPATINDFSLANSQIYGTIPATLLSLVGNSSLSAFTYHFHGNQITGEIPADLFVPLQNKSYMPNYAGLDFSSNALTGPIPSSLFDPLETLGAAFSLSVANNQLSGPLPTDLLANDIAQNLYLDITNNSLSGVLPQDFFSGLANGSKLSFYASDNNFIGPLPGSIFSPGWTPAAIYIDLSSNEISGTIPSGFLSSGFTQNVTLESVYLSLESNFLSGTIPETLLFNLNADASPVGLLVDSSFELNLGSNLLNGTIPTNLLSVSYEPGAIVYNIINLGSNELTGVIPPELLENLPGGTVSLVISNNQISGDLPYCPTSEAVLWLDLSANNLNGSIPSYWQNCKIASLSIKNNPDLTGTIPPWLLNSTTLTQFYASNTSITGAIPPLGTNLEEFDLSHTEVSFCDSISNSSISTYTGQCVVSNSEACNCPQVYSCASDVSCAPPTEPIMPSPMPYPGPTSSSCPPIQAQPGVSLICVNGFWTASTVAAPTFVVPSGAGKVIVQGDMDSSSIRFSDLVSSVEVNGCASSLDSVNVEISSSKAKGFGGGKLNQTLITATNTSCTNLNAVKLSSSVADGGCRKLKSEKSVSSNGQTLTGLFTVNSSSCNNWWIILVSVVSALVLIALIILIVAFALVPRLRLKVRPYANSGGRTTI